MYAAGPRGLTRQPVDEVDAPAFRAEIIAAGN